LVLDLGDLFLLSRRVLLGVNVIAGGGPLDSNAGVHISLQFQFGRGVPAVLDCILLLANSTRARDKWFRHVLDLARLGWVSESVIHEILLTATSNAPHPRP
jgi:hypothetical protein